MNKKERENWEKKRQKGWFYFVINNTLLAFIISISIFVVGNGYRAEDGFVDFLQRNFVDHFAFSGIIMIISFIVIFFASNIVWRITESRYKKSLEEEKESENA